MIALPRRVPITFGIGLFLFLAACHCPEDLRFDPPEEAVSYFDDHDTIRFYSEDKDAFEVFVVCDRSFLLDYSEISRDRCRQERSYFNREYICYKDSCHSDTYFSLTITHSGAVRYYGVYSDGHVDFFTGMPGIQPSFALEIEGKSYPDVIRLVREPSDNDSLVSIAYSHAFGVLEKEYKQAGFTLQVED
ncbi:MAG: hypothetical protein R2751_09800 [Bacteroidales bacterium]